jgi:ABC-type nitrate/sulfonate/bicarbonate transport system permease component
MSGRQGEPAAAIRAVTTPPAKPLRGELPAIEAAWWGFTTVAAVLALWFAVTAGSGGEDRLISPLVLPSPAETLSELPSLFEKGLVTNMLVTLRRVCLGFGLAAAIGVPLGVSAACFPVVRAVLAPVTIFGRNIPMAALIPLFFLMFGINEWGKVMFLFVASAAFVISDATAAVLEVPERYVDTALTLGASRRQIISKVLVPLAAPSIFNSLRLLFGLAFGYVMLAELVNAKSGVGAIINVSQRLGRREPILIVLILIALVAYAIDRLLWWLQCDLFPYRYGGRGVLPRFFHGLAHGFTAPTPKGEPAS